MTDSEDTTATCQCGCRLRDGEMIEAIAKAIESDAIQRARQIHQSRMAVPASSAYFVDGMNRAARIAREFKANG
jgi:hypothetical protein